MRKFQGIAFICATLVCSSLALCQKSQSHPQSSRQQQSQQQSQQERAWPAGYTEGPASISLGDGQGKLELPKGYLFLDAKATKEFFASSKQPSYPDEIGMVVPPKSTVDWYASIAYDGVGHINDSSAAEELKDSSKLLTQLQDTTREAYAKMPVGTPPAPTVIGWLRPPMYNAQTHCLLTSAVAQESGASDQLLNLTTRILGRHGFLSYTIAGNKTDAAYLEAQQAQLATCIHFAPGKDYASWQGSDGTSDIGLTGLVTGGAAVAVAAKTGLLAKLGSYLLAFLLALKKAFVAILAGGAAAIRWLKSKFTRKPSDPTLPTPDPPTAV